MLQAVSDAIDDAHRATRRANGAERRRRKINRMRTVERLSSGEMFR